MLNTTEQWLPVSGYESLYEVSDKGNIRNMRKNLAGHAHKQGYLAIRLTKEGTKKGFLLHRLVALAFIPNPGGLPMVNHLDGDKRNNVAKNLEWTTAGGNSKHAYDAGLVDPRQIARGVKQHNASSKYTGVSWDKWRNKWKTALSVEGRVCHQKRFNTEIEAAAYVNSVIDTLGITDLPKNVL